MCAEISSAQLFISTLGEGRAKEHEECFSPLMDSSISGDLLAGGGGSRHQSLDMWVKTPPEVYNPPGGDQMEESEPHPFFFFSETESD